jgi:MFS family permease
LRRWLRSTAGGLPGTFWVLWSGILIDRAGGFAVLFLSLYLTGPRHLAPAFAGAVVGGYGAGSAGGTLLGGVLADRWGRRRTLVLAHLGGAALLFGLGCGPAVPVIVPLVVLVGVAQGMPGPAFVAAIVDVVPEADRPRAFNLQFWAFNLGLAAASLLAGLVAEVSFAALFACDATTTLGAAVLILLRVPQSAPHRAGSGAPRREPGGTGTALRDWVFLVFAGLALVQAVITAQGSTILPLAMAADGLRPSGYGLVNGVAGLMITLGQLFVPGLIGQRRKGSVLALAMVLLAVGYGAVTVDNTLGAYLASAAVWTVGQMLAAPPNATIMAELSPPHLRARYQAVFFLTFSLASLLAPAVGGMSFQRLGAYHWLCCAGLGLAGAAGHLAAGGARERRVARTRRAGFCDPVTATR